MFIGADASRNHEREIVGTGTVRLSLVLNTYLAFVQCTYWKSICLRLIIFKVMYLIHCLMELSEKFTEIEVYPKFNNLFLQSAMHCTATV